MHYYEMLLDIEDEIGEAFNVPKLNWSDEFGDQTLYFKGEKLSVNEVLVEIGTKGEHRDIYMPMGIPIVTSAITELISKLVGPDEIQRIPAIVQDGRRMEALNILARYDCIDFQHSRGIMYLDERERQMKEAWSIIKPLPPYVKYIRDLIVDPAKAAGSHIFRIPEYFLPVIVSEDLKLELQLRGTSGVSFVKVTAD